MKNLRNRINVKLTSHKRNYFKLTFKPSYISHKIFDHKFVAICKSKATLMLKKSAYIGISTLELIKVLIYAFYYDYIENKYVNNSRLLFTETDSLMHGIKSEDVYEDFSNDKEMFGFSNYSTVSKYYDNSNKLVDHNSGHNDDKI